MHLEDKRLGSFIADNIASIQIRQATKYQVDLKDIPEEVTRAYIAALEEVPEYRELKQTIFNQVYLINKKLPPITKSTLDHFPEAQL